MILTRISLSNPVAVVVACLLLTIFGLISLSRLPIQLTPEILVVLTLKSGDYSS